MLPSLLLLASTHQCDIVHFKPFHLTTLTHATLAGLAAFAVAPSKHALTCHVNMTSFGSFAFALPPLVPHPHRLHRRSQRAHHMPTLLVLGSEVLSILVCNPYNKYNCTLDQASFLDSQ